MPVVAPQTKTDPLGAFVAGVVTSEGKRPIPLTSTKFDVTIDAGLAIVATERVFRNEEPNSIEATLTFPVPVHAALFALEARIDGRVMTAQARRRTDARGIYEFAMERGKGAALHEEVLRGVHMLSVGHIRPGGEVDVSTSWATTLTMVDGRGHLRIPLTVGDIYGRSGLPDSDELIHGGPPQTAELAVRCRSGTVELVGGRLEEGRAQVALNAPIDLAVTGWKPRDLHGRAADGRGVVLCVEPRLAGEEPLSVALLIDHSSSMGERCSGDGRTTTKHQAVIAGLKAIAEGLGGSDVVDVWEFDSALKHVGSTREPRKKLLDLIHGLSEPAGGTEIGAALAGVVGQSTARDVLLVTDGKSYALDVQALAQKGRRFSVVLVGEDSLEANVGHLAALTGGDTFVVAGTDLQDAMAAALSMLRRPCERPTPITGQLREVKTGRGNAMLLARWRPSAKPTGNSVLARGVAAVATTLALPVLDTEAATALAEAEGLVTHLTSLVLVDEAAEVQEAVPATRKIALPSPRTHAERFFAMPAGAVACVSPRDSVSGQMRLSKRLFDHEAEVRAASVNLSQAGPLIDWDFAPQQLIAGDLSAVEPAAAKLIERAATLPEVVLFAQQLNIDAIKLIVALVARAYASTNRSAARIARAILGVQRLVKVNAPARTTGLHKLTLSQQLDVLSATLGIGSGLSP